MPRKSRKSKRGKGSRDKRGIKNYDRNYSEHDSKISFKPINRRDRKTREKVTRKKRQVTKKARRRGLLLALNENINKQLLPPCRIERERTKRAFFSFRKSRPHAGKKNIGARRFTMRKCQ